jgi:hypothetical protein
MKIDSLLKLIKNNPQRFFEDIFYEVIWKIFYLDNHINIFYRNLYISLKNNLKKS